VAERRGLGTVLVRRLVEVGRRHGMKGLRPDVLASNPGMVGVLRRVGLTDRPLPEEGTYALHFTFPSESPSRACGWSQKPQSLRPCKSRQAPPGPARDMHLRQSMATLPEQRTKGPLGTTPPAKSGTSGEALLPSGAMSRAHVLVVDDEPNARGALSTLLTEEGFRVSEAGDGMAALAILREQGADVVLADVRMPRMDGLALVRAARAEGLPGAFVMMTAFATVEKAVEAMRAGAENFLTKPLDPGTILVVLDKVLENRDLARDADQLRARVRERFRIESIIGESAALQAIFEVVKRAAPTKATVLLLGESGTGKELVAQAIHQESPRRDKPFIKVNCAALSETVLESELFGHERGSFTGAVGRREGRFELADGGTLFLDEIGDIAPSVQVKLLRALQQREFERVGGTQTLKVDVRMVAATNRDLAAAVAAGKFREDLYYRLNVVAVTLPPLRLRKGDIPALVSHFIRLYAQSYGKHVRGLLPGTLNALLRYDWPGNVRELENVIERAVVLTAAVDLSADDLPPALRGPLPVHSGAGGLIPGARMREIEREAILRTLEVVGGSTSRAAEMLGISPRKIQYRLKEYGQEDATHSAKVAPPGDVPA
jgi:two-component system, NtrC family, response regulator